MGRYYDVRDDSKKDWPGTFLCEDRNCWCEYANLNAECTKGGWCPLGHKLEDYEDYTEVYYPVGKPLQEAARMLEEYHERGEKVYMRLNGTRIFSDRHSLDEVYMDMFGTTYDEFQIMKEVFFEFQKKKKDGTLDSEFL